jgi:MscS family membrane protein
LRAKLKLRGLFRPAWQFILLAALAFPAAAQAFSQRAATATPAEHVEDPLGRNTPRGTITGFNLAVYRNDFVSAGRYMQLSATQRPNTEALARDLTELMDRYFIHPVTTVSNSPEGAINDGLPLDRERVGPLTIGEKNIDIVLVRIHDPQAGPIWLISSQTLAQIPALRKLIGETWVERFMPKALASHTLFENSLALWIVWAGLIGIPLFLLWLLYGIFVFLVRTTIRDPARRRLVDSWCVALRWPLILLLTPIVQLASIPFLGFSFRFRIVNAQFAAVWLVAAMAWLLWQLLTLTFRHARIMVQRRGYVGTTSLMLLGERVLKVLIALVAIFAILKVAGIDTTTALAVVGIGGVAVSRWVHKRAWRIFLAEFSCSRTKRSPLVIPASSQTA